MRSFVNASDTSKSYIVVDFPEKSKADIYKQVERWVNKKYISPKDVVSKVDNESISINGVSKNAVRRNSMHSFDMNYTITVEFNDNKMKINAPWFRLTNLYNMKLQELHLVSNNSFTGSDLGIWSTSLKLKSEKAKLDLEDYFTKYISELQKGIVEKNDW